MLSGEAYSTDGNSRKGKAFPHIGWLSHRIPLWMAMIALKQTHAKEIISHAREAAPQECCGLIGGTTLGVAQTIYRARNVAADPLVAYEAAPEDLFAAQREMRERGEKLLAIYHSHPRSNDPKPS